MTDVNGVLVVLGLVVMAAIFLAAFGAIIDNRTPVWGKVLAYLFWAVVITMGAVWSFSGSPGGLAPDPPGSSLGSSSAGTDLNSNQLGSLPDPPYIETPPPPPPHPEELAPVPVQPPLGPP